MNISKGKKDQYYTIVHGHAMVQTKRDCPFCGSLKGCKRKHHMIAHETNKNDIRKEKFQG